MRLPEKIQKSPLCDRYLHNRAFRGIVGVWGGTAANLAFAAFRFVLGTLTASVFLLSSAVYYLIIGGMRASLGFAYRARARRGGFSYECRLYRRTARLLFLLNLPMGGMILLFVRTSPTVPYPGVTIYASATYTFYMMTLSIVNLVKYRRVGSPILSAAKALNFVAALFSLLGLQNALILTFSGEGAYRIMMNTLTGSAVYAAVIAVAIFMLRHPPKEPEEVPLEQIGK